MTRLFWNGWNICSKITVHRSVLHPHRLPDRAVAGLRLKAAAKERQLSTLKQGKESRGGNLPQREKGKSRDKAAKATGKKAKALGKAAAVVEAAEADRRVVAARRKTLVQMALGLSRVHGLPTRSPKRPAWMLARLRRQSMSSPLPSATLRTTALANTNHRRCLAWGRALAFRCIQAASPTCYWCRRPGRSAKCPPYPYPQVSVPRDAGRHTAPADSWAAAGLPGKRRGALQGQPASRSANGRDHET